MKRTLSFIMAIIMLAALCACGQSNSIKEPAAPVQNDVASAPETQTPDKSQEVVPDELSLIGIITDLKDLYTDDLKKLLRECGVELSMYGGFKVKYISQPSEALDAANNLLEKGCGTILFAATGTAEIAAQLENNHPSISEIIPLDSTLEK